jgi:ABC-type sugar transport system permease subunit
MLKRFTTSQARWAYAFMAPSLIVLALFVFWPIVQIFWLSLHNYSLVQAVNPFIGLDNFRDLLSDSRFWNSFRDSIYYTIGAVPVTTGLALAVALGLNERLRGTNVLRSAYFLPALSSLAVMGLVWQYLLNPDIGTVSYWLHAMGLPQVDFLDSTTLALPSVTFVGIWKNLGFDVVLFVAGLQAVPEMYYEAAKIDGAGRWQRFWHVTLPTLRPTTLFVVVTSVIGSFQVFDQVYVMTRGGPLFHTETLVTYMYHQGFEIFHLGYASAIAVVLFVFVLLISMFQLRLFGYSEVDS